MCGRYRLFDDDEDENIKAILNQIKQNESEELRTGEIFPTNKAPILLGFQGVIIPKLFTWGFPNFKNKGVIINARAETADEKPMFKNSVRYKRCVIPSTGFFEWSHTEEKKKYLFNLSSSNAKSSNALYMAGLYNEFNGESRFIILTTQANNSMKDIHNRMPVILLQNQINDWICDNAKTMQFLNNVPPELVKELA